MGNFDRVTLRLTPMPVVCVARKRGGLWLTPKQERGVECSGAVKMLSLFTCTCPNVQRLRSKSIFKKELEGSSWRPGKRSRKLPLELFRAKYDSSAASSPDSVRAVSSHFVGRSIEKMFPARKIIRTIVFCEPCHLLMSWYNFHNTQYILGPMSIKDFLCSLSTNPITTFCLSAGLNCLASPICLSNLR